MINQQLTTARQQLGYMQTQVDIIQSQRVARQVAKDLGLADNPSVIADWKKSGGKGTPEDWVAQGLLSKLKGDVSANSPPATQSSGLPLPPHFFPSPSHAGMSAERS